MTFPVETGDFQSPSLPNGKLIKTFGAVEPPGHDPNDQFVSKHLFLRVSEALESFAQLLERLET